MTAGTALRLAIEAQPDLPWTSEQHHSAQVALNMSKVREAALFLEKLQFPVGTFPSVYGDFTNVYLTEYKPYGTYDPDTESSLDIEASKRNMAFMMKQLPKPLKKEYTDYEFRVTYTMPSGYRIILAISRQTICKEVVKEKKWVEPQTIEGHFEEVKEYECDKVVFTGLDTDTEV